MFSAEPLEHNIAEKPDESTAVQEVECRQPAFPANCLKDTLFIFDKTLSGE